MKNKFFLLLLLSTLFTFQSCDWFKGKAKQTINKSGEIVSKSGSEFVSGVEKGVKKSFANKVILSEDLKKSGLEIGKIAINNSENATDNVLTVYLIFNKDFNREIQVKILDENNEEYGRISEKVEAKANEAKYVDFTFDKRTNIDGKSKILLN